MVAPQNYQLWLGTVNLKGLVSFIFTKEIVAESICFTMKILVWQRIFVVKMKVMCWLSIVKMHERGSHVAWLEGFG